MLEHSRKTYCYDHERMEILLQQASAETTQELGRFSWPSNQEPPELTITQSGWQWFSDDVEFRETLAQLRLPFARPQAVLQMLNRLGFTPAQALPVVCPCCGALQQLAGV